MTESFAELFEESLAAHSLKPGTIVTGIIMEIRDDSVVVNAGLKSEGFVPISQFRNLQGELEIEVGDEVQVALDTVEDGFGETRLSRDKAKRALVWDKLEGAFEGAETIEGKISGKVKGGFTVDIEDIRAFLPGSLVDVRPVRDPAYLEGKDLEFRSSNWIASATTSSCRVVRSSNLNSARSAKRCSNAWRRVSL